MYLVSDSLTGTDCLCTTPELYYANFSLAQHSQLLAYNSDSDPALIIL
jgi:hypothetical protein